MARQVLTYPDIPPVLTQAAADTRYSLVAHNHDASYLSQATADTRYLQLTGGTLTGTLTVSPSSGGATVNLRGNAGASRTIYWLTGSSMRWSVMANGVAEGGSNTGSNFSIWRHDDNGFSNYLVLTIPRATGIVDFTSTPTVGGVALPTFTTADARYLQPSTAASTYLPLAGGTLTGPLIAAPTATEAYSLVARNDRARASFQANTDTVIGRAGHEYAGAGMSLSNNLRTTTASGGWVRDDAAKLGANLSIGSGTTILNLASSTAASGNAPATLINRMQMLPSGSLTLNSDTGVAPLRVAGTSPAYMEAGSNGRVQLARYGQMIDAAIAYVTANAKYNGADWFLDDTTQDGVVLYGYGAPGSDSFNVSRYMAGANPATARLKTQLKVSNTGTLTMTPDAGGAAAVIMNRVGATYGWQFIPPETTGLDMAVTLSFVGPIWKWNNGWLAPANDNALYLGTASPAQRWIAVYAVNGTIQTSTADMKRGFAPLDPASCVAAVLETDWVSFSYLPPTPPGFDPPKEFAYDEHDSNEVKAEKKVARDEAEAGIKATYLKSVAETAHTRDQKGYILQSPEHKTHDLFGLADRESTSVASDLAVVACALQHCLLEIAELKARLA